MNIVAYPSSQIAFLGKDFDSDGDSITRQLPISVISSLESLLQRMKDANNKSWSARGASDAEDVKLLLATHTYTIEKGVEEGFGDVGEVWGLCGMRRRQNEVSGVVKALLRSTVRLPFDITARSW